MRRRTPPPWALTALLALVYVLVAPPTTDLAAQEHRIAVARDGTWLYDFSWFGGHHLPGYSVLMPVLGLALGPTTIAALSAVVAAWAFTRLVRPAWPGRGGTVAAWWFAAGVGGLLLTGRVTFLLGAAIALLTLWGAGRRTGARPGIRAGVAAIGAVGTALASPVAALFLAMTAGAWWLATLGGRTAAPPAAARPAAPPAAPPAAASDARPAPTAAHRPTDGPAPAPRDPAPWVPLLLAVVAFVAAGALALGFPTGGSEPFVASALWPAVALLAVTLAVLPRDERALRIGVAVYLAGVLLAGILPTPMGGNATRLAALAGGPVLAGALWGRRPVALALLAVPLLYWQWYPPVRDATQAWGDDSARAAAWAPLRQALDARLRTAPARVEVPPTARRGEVRWLGPDVPLARGWIRQLDRDRNPLFYADLRSAPLTGASYRRWLDDQAVGWVALPDAPADHASRDAVAVLRAGRVPGLRVSWRHDGWTLWRVVGARPLATWAGDGGSTAPRVTRATASEVVVEVPRGGVVDLRVRWSPYLRLRSRTPEARACLTRGPGGWTQVRADVRDTVSVGAGPAVPWRQPSRVDCTR